MPQSLQARVASRGYPVIDVSGQSGQGAEPDSTLPGGLVPGSPTASWTDPNLDPGSVPATLPPAEDYVLLAPMWGLSAERNPDNTPRTHAAPIADPTLPIAEYNAELEAAHSPEFTGVRIRRHPGTLRQFPYSEDIAQGSPAGPLQPLSGQIRSQAGYDGVQGYGGGGDGPGGTNGTMPLTVMDLSFPGQVYTPFVNAAETPLYTIDAVQFIAAAPELPAWTGGGFDGSTANVSAQDAVAVDVPATGPALSAAGAGLLPLWGSLDG